MRIASFGDLGVLVTGASSGIGRLLALRAGAEGAHVALVARREDRLEEVAQQVRDAGGRAVVLPCDVGDIERATETAQRAEQALGGVDVLINNAGFGRHRTFVEQDLGDMERLVRVNLLGTMAVTRAVVPPMIERGRGAVVFMASVAGLLPVPGESVYSATKFGMVGLAEALSIELEPRGVHVLTVCPGAVRTEFVPEDEQARMPPAALRTMIEPEVVVDATLRALRTGQRRIVVPRSLSVAVALRGVVPGLVRWGTARATRPVLPPEPDDA